MMLPGGYMDDDLGSSYLNGLLFGTPGTFNTLNVDHESFHPNVAGQDALATLLESHTS
jgi:hypothetical protein